jgi:recombinational DNA repair protein RecT
MNFHRRVNGRPETRLETQKRIENCKRANESVSYRSAFDAMRKKTILQTKVNTRDITYVHSERSRCLLPDKVSCLCYMMAFF